MIHGLIVRSLSGFYSVQTEAGIYICQLRGRFKKGPRVGDIAAIGDWVNITPLKNPHTEVGQDCVGTGVVEEIDLRQRMLSRMAPTPHGEYQQIIIANPEQVILVFSCSNPAPKMGMLDRFTVIAEKQAIPILIVANKVDLVGDRQAQELFGNYQEIGYPVIYVSAKTGQGVQCIQESLKDKLSVLVGPSGVGKSSLLNTIQPGLGLAVREISQATMKGKHTTVARQLFPLDFGGYLADTPGLKALALWDMEPEELDGYFPEMRSLVEECEYNDCRHVDEQNCAILNAVSSGAIHPSRYRSYLHMRLGDFEE
jgi:ribosome biogenesis GTPase